MRNEEVCHVWPHEARPNPKNTLAVSRDKPAWCLMSVAELLKTNELIGNANRPINSVLGHHCKQFEDKTREYQLLDLEDTMLGMCWWCKEEAPDDLKGLWMLHNFDMVCQVPDSWSDDVYTM